MSADRRFSSKNAPLGALPQPDGRTSFTVWAPKRHSVEVLVEGRAAALPLERRDGWFSGLHKVQPGERYRYRLDGGDAFADPCSRFQPDGPHGPSEVVDAGAFSWTDADWKGPAEQGNVIYELHVGAFTREGTYASLTERLPYLKDLGVTLIELMPLHECPGTFNWGYDGVDLFAPSHNYGRPDDLRRLVDRAHRLGLGVIVDAVYNHLGPDGNYLRQYAEYFTDRYPNEWGDPLDYDGPSSRPVRDFVIANACMWIHEYHCDGLRLDAPQALYDASPTHIVRELAAAVRETAAPRRVFLVGESERQDERLLRDGLDAISVDDFHHVNRVIATGGSEAYLQDYEGSARELVACVLRNTLYQGQHYAWQKAPRGTRLIGEPPHRIVFTLQTHDQVANTLDGTRLHQQGGPGLARALTALLLLAPQTPMLFMGQEHFSPSPFRYFVDHHGGLMRAVGTGRSAFLRQFPSLKAALDAESYRLDFGRAAFEASTLDWSRVDAQALEFHRELIALRRDIYADASSMDAAVLGPLTLCVRWPQHLLLLDLGADRALQFPSEPLLAPPPGMRWGLEFSSEHTRFGGRGAVAPSDGLGPWRLQGRSATLLEART